jgi:hypothetical protein
MRNLGDEPARYLVFEFHGKPEPASRGAARQRAAPALQ